MRTRILFVLMLLLLAALSVAQNAAGANRVVLGKLGQALVKTTIFASANPKARVYYRVPQYEYLVLQNAGSKSWLRVLLQNGTFGYVRAEHVARLPYDVTADPPARATRPRSPSRSGGGRAAGDVAWEGLQRYSGVRYVWGGEDPRTGMDCSGFVQHLFGKIGVNLPRTAAEQALVGVPVTRQEDLRPGDRLYFWEAKRNKIGHTGVYLGNGWFVHSSSGRGGVGTDYLGEPRWQKLLVAARRER